MMDDRHGIVTRALIQPEGLCSLSLSEWDLLIRLARSAGLLGRLHVLLRERDLLADVPFLIARHLESARVVADSNERVIRWEVSRIRLALKPTGVPIILLKGAAYVLANLPSSRGRMSSDIDILVPRDTLTVVEEALLRQGWEYEEHEEYYQRFYRTLSHELPPLRHRERKTVVDVHHAILPPTNRLHPKPEKLIHAAKAIDGPMLKILAPPDMVLHSAAHTFQDGYLERGLRELLDLDDLLRLFGSKAGFWSELAERAEELELTRPLFYALQFCRSFLHTPIPDSVLSSSQRWKAIWPVGIAMDRIMTRAMIPKHPANNELLTALARWLLYVRSHWLRMSPFLLASHLSRKGFRRLILKGKTPI